MNKFQFYVKDYTFSIFVIKLVDCTNDAGYSCKFPFAYNGENYYKCTRAGGYSKPWCFDLRGNDNWDYCSNCGKLNISLWYIKKLNVK